MRAPLVEVFSSIQGEGAFVGEPQSFVRLAGCPLRCRYCDSEPTWFATNNWRVGAGSGATSRANPASVDDVLGALESVESPGAKRTVSITGGEPLAQPEFVAELADALRAQGRRVHLETAGVHDPALETVLSRIDHVSADLKLSSTMESGRFLDAHRRFYARCAADAASWCVKCVVTPSVADAELAEGAALAAAADPDVLFILQPVTPFRSERNALSPERIQSLERIASSHLRRVRVLPQLHRALGLP